MFLSLNTIDLGGYLSEMFPSGALPRFNPMEGNVDKPPETAVIQLSLLLADGHEKTCNASGRRKNSAPHHNATS